MPERREAGQDTSDERQRDAEPHHSAPGRYCGSPGAVRLKSPSRNQPKTFEARRAGLVFDQIGEAARGILSWLVEAGAVESDEAFALGYGNGFSITPLITVKIAVAEPMPAVNATMASRATPLAPFHDRHACSRNTRLLRADFLTTE